MLTVLKFLAVMAVTVVISDFVTMFLGGIASSIFVERAAWIKVQLVYVSGMVPGIVLGVYLGKHVK